MPNPDRILIVDDDPDTLLLLEGVLQFAGFETATAHDGAGALSLLAERPFDLVLTDKNLAGEDGLVLLREIWKRFPQMGGAMITGMRSDDTSGLARETRLLAYFEKPIYDLTLVAETLKTVLQTHRQKREP